MNTADGPALRDIHLPPPPGWWPPAPGWWLLASIGLILLAWLLFRWHRSRVRRRREQTIMRELDRSIVAAGNDAVALAAALSLFLRRMALGDAPAAAAYDGERWLEYLDERGATDEFRRGVGRVLLEAPYRPQMDYDTSALTALVRRWTRSVLVARGAAHA